MSALGPLATIGAVAIPSPQVIRFCVPGAVRSTQSGSVIRPGGGKRAMPLRRNPQWTQACKLAAMAVRPPKPLTGYLSMGIAILVKPIQDRKRMGAFPTSGVDALNALKGPLDIWQGVLYRDDRQVIRFHRLEKIWAPAGVEDGLYVELWEIAKAGDVFRD